MRIGPAFLAPPASKDVEKFLDFKFFVVRYSHGKVRPHQFAKPPKKNVFSVRPTTVQYGGVSP